MSSCSRLTEAPLVVGPVTQALKVEKALPEEVERLMCALQTYQNYN